MSRYYTNVDLPDQFDNEYQMFLSIKHKDLEIELLKKRVDDLHSILENIPNAVIEHGYVEIKWDKNKKIILVSKDDQAK